MKPFIKYIYLLLLILITNRLIGQDIYISPVPGSKFHNRQTSIILTFESPINLNSLKSDLFTISGSIKKQYDSNYETSNNYKTIILKTQDLFHYGETIHVYANSKLELEAGVKINIPDFSFHIKNKEFETNTSYYEDKIYLKNKDYFPPITVNINDDPANGRIFFHNISAFASANDRFYAASLMA